MSRQNTHKARLAEIESKLHQARSAMAHTHIGEGSIHTIEQDIKHLEQQREALLADMDD